MKYISFVFQNTKLFKTSLLENIKYGNPDATMEEVERAVDMAQCREIINKLPLGLNTKIGTEGTYLSGGEQQRVNIARGLIRPMPLLLLDEPTASLDGINRQVVIDLIHEARQRGSAIVGIFHDDVARNAVADRIVPMDRP
jgi:ATP-binding cassette subfamily B protein IrtA